MYNNLYPGCIGEPPRLVILGHDLTNILSTNTIRIMQQPHNKSDSKVIGLPYSYVYTTSRATTTRSDIPLSDQEYSESSHYI